MTNDGYFRDSYIGDGVGNIRIRARCTQCGATVAILREAVSEEPCSDCGAEGAWREETDDEYAEYILGVSDRQEPLSARVTSAIGEPLEDEWSHVQEKLVESIEGFGDGRLARWLRSKVRDRGPWITRILNDFYTRDFLKRVGRLVERTIRLNTMESRVNPGRGVNLYLREATRCCIFGFWDSSVALSRAAVELALKDRLKERLRGNTPADDELKLLLEYAHMTKLIDGAHFTMADKVRLAGNNALHGVHVQENDAWDTLFAARGVLNQLYSRL